MKRVLVTGGTGSFGNAVVRRLLNDSSIEHILIFSRDEWKQHEMREHLGSDKRLALWVGDVRDKESVERAMRGIDTVFHAAALKQVPTGEFFPMEMVRTNIHGTENVLAAAETSDSVKKVVFLSTDKAVYPANVMGMSKAIAEKIVAARSREWEHCTFCTVRFGNVAASRGSVIPVFIDRIKSGKELRLTNPDMTRFLLSLDDAIELVFFAMKKGESGDLFIKKAPAATIKDLTQALLNIFKASNKVNVVGMRAGEKMHETLATRLELSMAEEIENYFRVRRAGEFEYDQFFTQGIARDIGEDYTSENTARLSVPEIEKLLLSLEYVQEELKK